MRLRIILSGVLAGLLVIAAGAIPVIGRPDAVAPALRILPLGDSITWGWAPPASTPGGYRGFLHDSLLQSEIRHQFVGASNANSSVALSAAKQARHDGHNGYRIDQIDKNLDGVAGGLDDRGGYWLTGTYFRGAIHPDVVLLHLGTNDITQRFDPTNTYDDGEPLDEAEERARFVAAMTGRLQALVDRILGLRPNATVFVATIVPLTTGQVVDVVVPEYNRAIRNLVPELGAAGKAVRLVDVHQAFMTQGAPTPGLLASDGVHPTTAGHAVIGRLLGEHVDTAF